MNTIAVEDCYLYQQQPTRKPSFLQQSEGRPRTTFILFISKSPKPLKRKCRNLLSGSLIVVIDDCSDEDALSPKNSQFIQHLFCVVPEFNFTTFLFTHKFNDTDIKHRNNANGFINFSPLTASINRARAAGTATKILDNKLDLCEIVAKQLSIKHSNCAYISMDIRRMENGGNMKIDEQERTEQCAWWYIADKEFKMPSEKEQMRWFGVEEEADAKVTDADDISIDSKSTDASVRMGVTYLGLSPLTDDSDDDL